MIQNIRHKGLRRFFEKGDASRLNPDHVTKLRLMLTVLENASYIEDINFPGSRLHPLRGNLRGFWSVHVSGNWRIVFRFEDGDVYDVDYLDYH